MYYDNQVVMYIVNNPVFHEQMKYIEVDCHFIRDIVMTHRIISSFVTSSSQLRDIFTKALCRKSFSMCSKVGMIDILCSSLRGVLEQKQDFLFLYFEFSYSLYDIVYSPNLIRTCTSFLYKYTTTPQLRVYHLLSILTGPKSPRQFYHLHGYFNKNIPEESFTGANKETTEMRQPRSESRVGQHQI